jgi:hypothetical protein
MQDFNLKIQSINGKSKILFISKNRQARLNFRCPAIEFFALLLSDSAHNSAPSGTKRSYDFRPSFSEGVNFKR